MKYTLSIIFFTIILIGCGSRKEKTITTDPDTRSSPDSIECYQYINSLDTLTMQLIHAGTSITGTLVYKLYQKDMNKGTIQGGMQGNLLIADYTFMSEGRSSVRQVVFKKENDTYIAGYGDILTNNGRIIFRNIDSLRFDAPLRLIPVNCPE